MLSKETITLLEEIIEQQFDFSSCDAIQLTYQLIENIGDKNSHIRDRLIYPVLAHLLHDDVLEKEELQKIAALLMSDKYLFYDMDNQVEDSVLKRSFTVLQLVILFYKHRKDGILEEEFFTESVKRVITYYMNETDYRGYNEEVGFLHSNAHGADLFAQIVQHQEVKMETLEVILEVIKDKFKILEYMFVHDEDERSVTVLEHAIKRNVLSEEFLVEYIRNFGRFEKGKLYPLVYHIVRNVKCFLRSLYFRFIDDESYLFLTNEIKTVLKEVR